MEYPPKDDADILEDESVQISKEKPIEKRLLTVNEHGLSKDYLNEFNITNLWIKDLLADEYNKNDPEELLDLKIITSGLNSKFQNKELKKYTERLRDEEYGNVKNEKNQNLIKELDEKIDEIYSIMNGVELTPENIDQNKYKLKEVLETYDDIKSLIEEGVSRRIAA